MNIKKKILSAALLACISLSAMAQQSIIAQQRRAIDEALTTLEDYISMATILDNETYYNFIDLFESPTVQVYNDLIGLSTASNIPVNQYAARLSRGVGNKKVLISNVRNEGASFTNGKWQIKLSFDKRISYIDSCGTFLSSYEYFDSLDYRLTATLNYDPSKNLCKISEIIGKIDSSKKLGSQFFAFQRTDPRDDELYYKKDLLKFNSYDQALLVGSRDSIALKNDFSYSNPDMVLRLQTNDCLVSMKYKLRRLRLRSHFEFGLGNAYLCDGDDVFSDSKNAGYSFGLDLGIGIASSRSFSLAIYTGIGFSQSTMDLSYQNSDYSFESKADVDGENYIRHYKDLKLSQKMKFNELNIPLYLDFNFKIVNSLSFYIDLGARFDLDMGHKADATEGSAEAYGIYTQYNNLKLDNHWPYNGFGNHQYGNVDLVNADLINVNSFTVSGMGGVGFRYNLSNIPLSFELGTNYVMGLMNLIETTSISAPGNSTPIVFNTISGTSSAEHVRNLTEMLKSMKRQQLRFNIGLIYKL